MRDRLVDRWHRLMRRGTASDIDDELAFHIEMRARELEASGESPERARDRALARFGDVSSVRSRLRTMAERRERKMERTRYVEELGQDVRFAMRTLVRSPAFTLIAVATLALGIGANSAIFSVVNGVLLRPLPFPSAERVHHWGWDWGSGPQGWLSAYKLDYFRGRAESYAGVATYRGFSPTLGRGSETVGVGGLRVSADFLDVVGYRLALGRPFDVEESAPGGRPVAILGHDLWRTRFDADPGVLGRNVVLNGEPHAVVGVLPREFRFPQLRGAVDVLVPLRLEPDIRDEGHNWEAIVRLAPGIDRSMAESELAVLSRRFRADHPDLIGQNERGMRLTDFKAVHVGSLGGVLWTLLGAVGLVLLIACANVANLLLARTEERRRELAVRSAVGASRSRLVRQILAESLVLAGAAGALGLAVGVVSTRLLLSAIPSELPRAGEIGLDARVVLFTFGAAAVTAVVFGLAAAVPSSERIGSATLREGNRGTASGRWLRNVLVSVEAGVAVVLLVGAGLLIGTLLQLRSVDPGFRTDGVLTATVPRWTDEYRTTEALTRLEEQLLPRLESSGAIARAATGSNVPLERGLNLPVEIEGRPDAWEGDVEWRAVSDHYFATLEIPLVRGRGFGAGDVVGAPRVAIVNEAFVKRFFPDSEPVGQRVVIGRYKGNWIAPEFAGEPATIVGVAADVREMALRREPKRTVFVPRAQAALAVSPVFLLRPAGRDLGHQAAVTLRTALRDLDPALPAPEFSSMEDVVRESVAVERFNALLMSIFAGIAVFLTAVGIFGVVSYGVRRRTREIGIRMALGARSAAVTRLVTLQGILPVAIGVAVGALAAVGLSRFIRSMIWGIDAIDPATYGAGLALIAAVSLLASWIPARRAARADPMSALRED